MMLFGSRRRRERQSAERLYAAAVAAARRPVLYVTYGVEDTLQGRFEMMTLHLFPLLHRLMHDPGDDPELARRISEALVVDMDGAFREMGVGDLTVPKRMKTLYRSFAGRISAYADALAVGEAELAAAVARNVYPESSQDGRGVELSRYLALLVRALREPGIEALREGVLNYPEPPEAVAQEVVA